MDLTLIRSHLEQAEKLAGEDPSRVDVEVVVRIGLVLLGNLEQTGPELLLLRDIVADLDEFFDSEEGPIMQPDHSCRPQRRLAQFYREIYKPNAAQRGHKQVQRTWGRGR